jgi:hypothetical protein
VGIKADRLKLTGTAAHWVNRNENSPDFDFNMLIKKNEPLKELTNIVKKLYLRLTKKSYDVTTMMPYINRYLYSDRVPGDWQLQRVIEYARTNPDEFNATLIAAVNKDRKKMMDEWFFYLDRVNEDYARDPFFKHFVISAILEKLEDGTPALPPSLDAAALSMLHNEIVTRIDHQSFYKYYSKFGIQIATEHAKISGNNFDMASGGTWIKVPQTQHADPLWPINREQVRMMSHSNWCTAGSAADTYLPRGDFWIFHENGGAKLAIRFEGDNVGEIQGPSNNGVIPASHADKVEELVLTGGINLNSSQTLQLAIALEQGDAGSLNYEGIPLDYNACIKHVVSKDLDNYVTKFVIQINTSNEAHHYHSQNMGNNKIKAMKEGYITMSGMANGTGKPPRLYFHPDNSSYNIIQNMNKNLFYLSSCSHPVILRMAVLGYNDAIDLVRDSFKENRNRYATFEEAMSVHIAFSDRLTDILDEFDPKSLKMPSFTPVPESKRKKAVGQYDLVYPREMYTIDGADPSMVLHYETHNRFAIYDGVEIKIGGYLVGSVRLHTAEVYSSITKKGSPNRSTEPNTIERLFQGCITSLSNIEYSDYDVNILRLGEDYQARHLEKMYRVPWKNVKNWMNPDYPGRYAAHDILHTQFPLIQQKTPKVTEIDKFIPKPLPSPKDIAKIAAGVDKVAKRYKLLLEV